MISEICSKDKCLGCALCSSICPQQAISINVIEGFYRPVIADNCISCGACIKNCPAIHNELVEKNTEPDTAFAAWCKDQKIHFSSTSGGLAYFISYTFINNGGAVVGVWFNANSRSVEHRLYETTDDLHCIRGSRYVNSNKKNIYRIAAEKLNEKDVLFIGVPCEVNAMKQYVSKHTYEHNLFCIDTLCRGGSSPKCLNEHISAVSFGRKIEDVSFRGGNYDCAFVMWGKNRKILHCDWQYKDPYFFAFMKHSIFQKACFSCGFAESKRVGDLTLGDFWGLDPEIEKQTSIQGINMLLVNTNNGKELIESIKENVVLIPRPFEEAKNGNDTLREATPMPLEYDELWNCIQQSGFHKAMRKVYGIDWRIRFIRSYLRELKDTTLKRIR